MEVARCHGEGEIEVGTVRDEFGNWDTETYKCAGCPDCEPPHKRACGRCLARVRRNHTWDRCFLAAPKGYGTCHVHRAQEGSV